MCSVLLGTIVILAYYGSRVNDFGGISGGRRNSRDSGGGGAGAIIVVLAFCWQFSRLFLRNLIYFAISRKREYLADASLRCIPGIRKD